MKTLQSKIFYNKIFISLLGIIVIWNSGNALYTISPFSKYASYLLLLGGFCFIPSIFHLFANNKINVYMMGFISFGLMIFFTALTHLTDGIASYIFMSFTIILAFGITITYSFDDFVDLFLKIMVVSSIIALVGFYLQQNTYLLNNLPRYVNVNEVQYAIGFVWNYMIPSERNCGMFWEPGLFATFLIYAIVFELFFKKKKISIARLILFSVCIFSANSSAGYALWFVCIILFFVRKDRKRNENIFFYLLFTILFAFGLIAFANLDHIILNTKLSDNKIFLKLLSENIVQSSRALSLTHYLNIFFENPFFGAGYVINSLEGAYSGTSTSTMMLSIYGIFGSLYTLFFIYGVFNNKSKNLYAKICIITIIISIINKEPHFNILFTWCLLFYLLKNSVTDRIELKRSNDQ